MADEGDRRSPDDLTASTAPLAGSAPTPDAEARREAEFRAWAAAREAKLAKQAAKEERKAAARAAKAAAAAAAAIRAASRAFLRSWSWASASESIRSASCRLEAERVSVFGTSGRSISASARSTSLWDAWR